MPSILCRPDCVNWLKQIETHGCETSTVATDALVLKHQGISTHSTDQLLIIMDQFQREVLQPWEPILD